VLVSTNKLLLTVLSVLAVTIILSISEAASTINRNGDLVAYKCTGVTEICWSFCWHHIIVCDNKNDRQNNRI